MQFIGIVIAVLAILTIAAGLIIAGFVLAVKPCSPEECAGGKGFDIPEHCLTATEKTDTLFHIH